MLRLDGVSKDFFTPTPIHVLKDISMTIQTGQWVSLMGPSGSGKSTLLSLLAGLDTPTKGEVLLQGCPFSALNEEQRSTSRSQQMGFIFQSFRLIPHLNIRENIAVPMKILGLPEEESEERITKLLQQVGLKNRDTHFPSQLSGGEQQRVAIARAFSSKPPLLLADEPTGNLDEENSAVILEMLENLKQNEGTTLFVVSHDPAVAQKADVQLILRNGSLQNDSRQEP